MSPAILILCGSLLSWPQPVAGGARPPGQVRVTFLVDLPPSTPYGVQLWITGDAPELGRWNGAGVRLTPAGDRRFIGTVVFPKDTRLQFKVTQGGWLTVEKDSLNQEFPARRWTATRDDTVRVQVSGWYDPIRMQIDQGAYAAAEDSARARYARQTARYGMESPESAFSLDLLVESLWRNGKGGTAEALARAHEAVGLRERLGGPDDRRLIRSLDNLGTVLSSAGDYGAARPVMERCAALAMAHYGPEHTATTQALNGLADGLFWVGDYAEARALWQRTLATDTRIQGPGAGVLPVTLSNLGLCALLQRDYPAARDYLGRALEPLARIFGPEHLFTISTRRDLGIAMAESGQRDSGLILVRAAAEATEKAAGPDHPELALTLNALGRILMQDGRFEAARSPLERALAISESQLGPRHPDVTSNRLDLALLAAAEGRYREAFGSALQVETLAREQLRHTVRTLPERGALSYLNERVSGLDLALALLAQHGPDLDADAPAQAWDAVVRSRSVVLDEVAARHRTAMTASDTTLARLAAQRNAAWQRMSELEVRGPGESSAETYRRMLDQTRRDAETADVGLADRSARFRQERAEQAIGLDGVRATLQPRTALVAFVRYNDSDIPKAKAIPGIDRLPRYLAFVLRPRGSGPSSVPLGAAAGVDSLVARWSTRVSLREAGPDSTLDEADYREVGAALRARIWDPVAPLVRGSDLLFVVPDGSLELVNFATLPVETTGYLLEHGPLFHVLDCERDLASRPATETPGEGLLSLGDPDYDSRIALSRGSGEQESGDATPAGAVATFRGPRPACVDLQRLHWERLAGTAGEVVDLAGVWTSGSRNVRGRREGSARHEAPEDVVTLTGAAANEAAFKLRAPGRRVLHIATHAFFTGAACASASGRERGIGFTEAIPRDEPAGNPLLLSGFVLAGANRRADAGPDDEDGILTSEEVSALDLRSVEWAVLSGCETGIGEVRAGEGVLGMRRAFRIAGARTVVMSLWPVQDLVTRDWMRRFFTARLVEGRGAASAVREASRGELRQRRRAGLSTHPFYWGAFVAAGDWR